MKSVLWRVAKRLSYIEDARCPKVKLMECEDVECEYGKWMTANEESRGLN